jgi:uncharacterized protein YjbJ (UPF0337 family)
VPKENDEGYCALKSAGVNIIEIGRNAMKSSAKDKAEGKWHKVKGKIRQIAGKAVGNRRLENEGKAENVGGSVQEKIGEIKDVVGK